MVEMREQFEDKFQIKMMLYQLHGKIAFIDEINDYRPTITNQGELTENEHRGVAWIQGAWYAFQEQKKQLDLIKKLAVGLRNEFNLWADDTESFDAIEAQIENLEAVLK